MQARVRFYEVDKFGYYRKGNERPVLSDLRDSLARVAAWGKDGRSMVNTTTYEADPDNDIHNTYFSNLAFRDQNNDAVLILWNEVSNDNGVIYGINPHTAPGTTQMLHTDFGNNPAIPGCPSYFWFIPAENLVASIRFDHSVHGKANLERYMSGFLFNKSPYRVRDQDGTVIGYSPDGAYFQGCEKNNPRVNFVSKKQNEIEQQLFANIGSINKIIKKEVLRYAVADDRQKIERYFSGLLGNAPQYIENRTVTHELPFRPTEAQLAEIIRSFREMDERGSLRNVGFGFSDGKSVMLDGSIVSFTYDFDLPQRENHIVPATQLLDALTNARADLLRAAR